MNKHLQQALHKQGWDVCPSCGRDIDRGDIAWNAGSTEAGTPLTYVEIQCARCDHDVAYFYSWMPEVYDFDEVVQLIEEYRRW